MEFPHINDTKFPHIDNVDVYKYKNDFNYLRWQGKAIYKLINVRWNSDYTDVPYFASEDERDEWFDDIEGKVGTLESVFNNTPERSLKIPVPYNVAYDYNYLVIEMPLQTSEQQPINYEDKNARTSRWYFFIEDMEQTAPNTTELFISVDYWTTFIHQVEIPYLMLERGHAPMTKTTVEQFLANPINNNEYLLADDFNYGNDTVIQTSNYYVIGSGVKYVLFAAPYSVADFANFGAASYSGQSTPPTYANIDNRWGYQLQVNDYQWKYGNADYSNANLPIHNQVQDGILDGCAIYAIEGQYAQAFFNYCIENCVNFIHGIKCMFILDGDLFNRGTAFTFKQYTIYPVTRNHIETPISLNKNQFGFDSKYANITKLYTSPYSVLEVTDDEGNVFSAKVENCGSIDLHIEVSLLYPYLNYNVFFSGINGDSSMSYEWMNVDNSISNMEMWASDFSKFMMNWGVPTYSLFISSENEYAANNFFGNAAKRAGAIKDYQNAVRYANTTFENTADSFDTSTDNVAATGATNTANTNRTTSTMVTNVAADMSTMVTNVAADMQTMIDNNATACDTATANMTQVHNVRQGNIVDYNNTKIDDDAAVANSITYQTTQAQNEFATATYGNTQTANVISGAIGSFGSMVSGGLHNGGVGAISGGVSGVFSQAQALPQIQAAGANLLCSISTSQTVADLGVNATNAYAAIAKRTNSNVLQEQQIEGSALTQNNNDSATTQTGRTAATNNADAGRTAATNNADAGRTKATDDANAAATQATNNANAVRTQNTETNNADWNRDATVEAEKANLVQKQLEVENTYKNARLQRPTQQGEYAGDFTGDVYKRRGVRFNIRTQSKSAIAQTGDAMLRFGYAIHRIWDMSNGFHYGRHFTFWKAEDVWINDGAGVANDATNTIHDILMKGVTVWRNPNEIGSVSIYDNI